MCPPQEPVHMSAGVRRFRTVGYCRTSLSIFHIAGKRHSAIQLFMASRTTSGVSMTVALLHPVVFRLVHRYFMLSAFLPPAGHRLPGRGCIQSLPRSGRLSSCVPWKESVDDCFRFRPAQCRHSCSLTLTCDLVSCRVRLAVPPKIAFGVFFIADVSSALAA